MYKKYFKTATFCFFIMAFGFFKANAQVGIGTVLPDTSSILDVTSTNKGVSFPNVNLVSETDAVTITSPKVGLMVYNTNTTLPCGKGLYFNNGTVAAPIWSCFSKTTKQYHAYNTSGRLAVTTNTATLQPGCTINIVIPTGQTADIKIDGVLGGRNAATTASAYSTFDAIIYYDGAFLPQGGFNRTTIVNPNPGTNGFNVCTMSTTVLNATAGSHTIQLFSKRLAGTVAVDLGGDCALDTNCGEIHAVVTYK
jgi:hypothetical protein